MKELIKKLPADNGSFTCLQREQKGDEIWIARYLLDRLTENYGYYIEYHPKPVKGDWNGSGMHANFSNSVLRSCGSKETYEKIW